MLESTGPSIDDSVGSIAGVENVSIKTFSAFQNVRTLAAVQNIIAITPDEFVRAYTSFEIINRTTSGQHILAAAAVQLTAIGTRLKNVNLIITEQYILCRGRFSIFELR